MSDSLKKLWFLRVFGLNLCSTVYKYVLVSVAVYAVLQSPCEWIPVPSMVGYCEKEILKEKEAKEEPFVPKEWINGIIIFAAAVEWLNNFQFFNILYKLVLCTLLAQRGPFFFELRKMLYSSSAFKEGGLVSCNPAELWPSILQLPEEGFLHAVEDVAEEIIGEPRADERGVFRFVIGQLDINIKTNQLTSNRQKWHLESITNVKDSDTEVLLYELSSQQVNLLVRVLQAWEAQPFVGVIQSTSKWLSVTVLHAMQLSEIVEHITAGKDILIHDTSLSGKRVFIAGEFGSVKCKQKKNSKAQ